MALSSSEVARRSARPGLFQRAVQRDWDTPRMRGVQQYPFLNAVLVTYLIVATGIMVSVGSPLRFPYLALIALTAAGLLFRAPRLVWVSNYLVCAGLLFFGLDGFSEHARSITHITQPINTLGGGSFVVWAHNTYMTSPLHTVLTPVLLLAYMSLWFGPLTAVIWIWLKHPERLGRFASAFMLLECCGFLIYLLYPETPPWLAAQQGYLAAVGREVVQALQPFFGLGQSYAASDPAPLSAMPAMHVADPTLVGWTLFAVSRGDHKFAWAWLLYPLSVAVAVLSFAEHYPIDVIVALSLGTTVFVVAEIWNRRRPTDIEPHDQQLQ